MTSLRVSLSLSCGHSATLCVLRSVRMSYTGQHMPMSRVQVSVSSLAMNAGLPFWSLIS